jgi:hypothetical protein
MSLKMKFLIASMSLVAHLTTAVDALTRREKSAAFATFIYPTKEGNLTFAINADASSGDVYFYLASPASYQWVGIGTGSEMDGSVMWVVYPSSSPNGPSMFLWSGYKIRRKVETVGSGVLRIAYLKVS